jgi:glucose/mannose-6-phosphate isomerase
LSILDDVEKIRGIDPGNMYNRIFDLPEQMAEALQIGQKWQFNAGDFADVKNIVVIGMGGSAIGGELVRSYLSSRLLTPIQICRHYQLPEYVDDETLVIASSYSGNTEETLAAVNDALNRKSMIAAISTGGLLNDVAKLNDIPLAQLPPGLQPRAALGYSMVPILVFLERINLISGVTDDISAVVSRLQEFRENYIEDLPTKVNLAKQLAEKLHGKIPIIYTGPTLTDAVGLRWKGQICENSKTLAFVNQFAEFNHNELVGWSDPVKAHAEHLVVVMLRDVDDHPQIRKRMNFVQEIIEKRQVPVIEVHSKGEHPLQRMFYLIQLGDFTSYYLATLNEVDPTPVEVIEHLKKMLAEKKTVV